MHMRSMHALRHAGAHTHTHIHTRARARAKYKEVVLTVNLADDTGIQHHEEVTTFGGVTSSLKTSPTGDCMYLLSTQVGIYGRCIRRYAANLLGRTYNSNEPSRKCEPVQLLPLCPSLPPALLVFLVLFLLLFFSCMVWTCHTPRQPLQNHPSRHLGGWATPWSAEETLDGQHQLSLIHI